jgi:N6-L-threonylcarbamoyladenine synthase
VDASGKALQEFGISQLGIAGGVAANSSLRIRLSSLCEKMGTDFYYPAFEYCTDNAAMIGRAAYFKYQQKMFAELSEGTESRLAIGHS